MKDNQDHFNVLRKIQKKPDSSQRELAEDLGFSLGKLNYCLKALQNKGLVKIKNFQQKNSHSTRANLYWLQIGSKLKFHQRANLPIWTESLCQSALRGHFSAFHFQNGTFHFGVGTH